jgi:hypothetical protein
MGGIPDLIFVIDTNKEQTSRSRKRAASASRSRDRRHQLRSGRHHLSDAGQ